MRTELVKFLLWVYSSQAASDIAASLMFVPLPPFVLDAHQVTQSLQSSVFCQGVLALSSSAQDAFRGGITTVRPRVFLHPRSCPSRCLSHMRLPIASP